MTSKIQELDVNHVARGILSQTDYFLARLIRILSTPAGLDRTLCTLQYILKVIYTQLSKLQGLRYERLLLTISSKLSAALLPGETVIATLSPPQDRLSHVISGSRALSGLISDFRTFTRLWGLLDVYAWGKGTLENPPEDGVIKAITWSQITAIAAYQWYENIAYLSSKGVLQGPRFDARQQVKWYEWSSRFWMAHIALEAVRLARVWQTSSTASTTSEDEVARKEQDALWRRQACVNTAWAPVSVHYSWEKGVLSEDWLAVLGLIAGSTGFRHMWKQTAVST